MSSQDNAKLLHYLKSGFKRTIKWKKYQSDLKTYAQSQYLNHLINLRFQGVNRLPKVEIKDLRVKIDGQNVFDQAMKKDIKVKEEKLPLVKEMITQLVIC